MGKSLLRQDLQPCQPSLWFGDSEERGWEWVFRHPYSCIGTCPGMALSSSWCCLAPIWIDYVLSVRRVAIHGSLCYSELNDMHRRNQVLN